MSATEVLQEDVAVALDRALVALHFREMFRRLSELSRNRLEADVASLSAARRALRDAREE